MTSIRIYDAEFAQYGTTHQHLQTFWWIDVYGRTGRWSRLDAYNYVIVHPKEAYVSSGNEKVLVGARTNDNGTKWIQTYANGVWQDNLTALAERHARGLANV